MKSLHRLRACRAFGGTTRLESFPPSECPKGTSAIMRSEPIRRILHGLLAKRGFVAVRPSDSHGGSSRQYRPPSALRPSRARSLQPVDLRTFLKGSRGPVVADCRYCFSACVSRSAMQPGARWTSTRWQSKVIGTRHSKEVLSSDPRRTAQASAIQIGRRTCPAASDRREPSPRKGCNSVSVSLKVLNRCPRAARSRRSC
jgi:hypothetical protein